MVHSKDRNTNLYDELLEKKGQGQIFSRKDLTYDVLYQLSIKEEIIDSQIGNIFGLTKSQVKYLRNKYNLNNIFLKKCLDFSDQYMKQIEEREDMPNSITKELYLKSLQMYASNKGWKTDIFNEYLETKNPTVEDLSQLEIDYDVVLSHDIEIKKKNVQTSKRQNHGKNTNQLKSQSHKIESGKLGEKIVYQNEIKKLQQMNRYDLAEKVEWISRTNQDDITYDGLGYDIISYNDLGEKIYIEVKCSTTNQKDISFYISSKEVEFMQGKIDGIDKNHCFIYYVYRINKELSIAEVLVIDYHTFQQLQLVPKNYQVIESFEKRS